MHALDKQMQAVVPARYRLRRFTLRRLLVRYAIRTGAQDDLAQKNIFFNLRWRD
jgi:hypothetical protein